MAENNQERKSFLDELGDEQKSEQERRDKVADQEEDLSSVIEKMKNYAIKIQELGKDVEFAAVNDVKWSTTEVIREGVAFTAITEIEGKDKDSEMKDHVHEILDKTPGRSSLFLSAYNTEKTGTIIFSAEINGCYLYYERIGRADVGVSPAKIEFPKGDAFYLKKGVIKLKPEGFSDTDAENCFKFLLDKSRTVYLSENANAAGKTGGCFIATAVYGSENAPEVIALRIFRDDLLLPYKIGRSFVNFYYFFSPSVAKLLNRNLSLCKVVRKIIIQPIVEIANSMISNSNR